MVELVIEWDLPPQERQTNNAVQQVSGDASTDRICAASPTCGARPLPLHSNGGANAQLHRNSSIVLVDLV